MRNPEAEELQDIGRGVAITACEMFDYAGRESDFCIQLASDYGNSVFGGTNRLLYSPKGGWSVSQDHCTEGFIEKFKEWVVEKKIASRQVFS